MVYNLTGIADNSTTILGFVQGVNNTLSLGWLGTFFLIGIAVIVYMSFIYSTNDVNKSLAGTAFITFILTLLLVAVDLITNPKVIFITLIASAATIAFTWKRG